LRIRIPDPDPWFDDLKLKKKYSWKFYFYLLDKKLQFTYPYAYIKDAQATGEAFSLHSLQNMKILYFFQLLWVIFALLDPDPATQIYADPDPDRNPAIFKQLQVY
jgi:hypothetical protein